MAKKERLSLIPKNKPTKNDHKYTVPSIDEILELGTTNAAIGVGINYSPIGIVNHSNNPVDLNRTGNEIAGIGFDEISGSWMNVGRPVVDINTGFANTRKGSQAIPSHYLPVSLKEQLRHAQKWREDD